MATWGDLTSSDPAMADAGRGLLYQFAGVGLAFLGTVRKDGVARLHPVCPLLTTDRMYVFVVPSSKRNDLLRDGRCALHSFPCEDNEDAFGVTGRARARRGRCDMAAPRGPVRRRTGGHRSPEARRRRSAVRGVDRLVLRHAHDRSRRPSSPASALARLTGAKIARCGAVWSSPPSSR